MLYLIVTIVVFLSASAFLSCIVLILFNSLNKYIFSSKPSKIIFKPNDPHYFTKKAEIKYLNEITILKAEIVYLSKKLLQYKMNEEQYKDLNSTASTAVSLYENKGD